MTLNSIKSSLYETEMLWILLSLSLFKIKVGIEISLLKLLFEKWYLSRKYLGS